MFYRVTNCYGFDEHNARIQAGITKHRKALDTQYPISYTHTNLTLDESYNVLSILSNYHWGKYIGIVNWKEKRILSVKANRMECNRSYISRGDTKHKGNTPHSIRNRCIYFLVQNDIPSVTELLRFHYDSTIPASCVADPVDLPEIDIATGDIEPRVTKMSRNVGHTETQAGTTVNNITNMTTAQTVYEYFVDRISSACFLWRLHAPQADVIAMSDLDLHGKLIPNSFVHIYRDSTGQETNVSCSCTLYRNMKQCLHTRYFSEYVNVHVPALFLDDNSAATSFQKQFLQKSLSHLNRGVVLLSDNAATVKKFSVITINNLKHSFVHLTGDNYVTCQTSVCQIKNRHKRKADTLLDNGDNICLHLEAMRANHEQWTEHLHNVQEEMKAPKKVCAINYRLNPTLPGT